MLGGALLLAGSAARAADAPDERARARAAYDRGVAAQGRGDFAAAAREFAAADAIVPSQAALGAAQEAAASVDDPVLGAELCERAAARSPEGKVPAERRAVCDAARRRTGKIVVTCSHAVAALPTDAGAARSAQGGAAGSPGGSGEGRRDSQGEPRSKSAGCDATIDGAAARADRPVVVLVGAHTIQGKNGSQTWTKRVSVAAGETVNVDAPQAGSGGSGGADGGGGGDGGGAGGATEMASKQLISPLWTIAAGALTGASAGFAIGSGVDTKSKHDAFVALGCPGPVHGDCAARARRGAFAQDRTNVLVGATIGLAAATAVLGAVTLFATRPAPRGEDKARVEVAVTACGALLRGTFE